MTDLDVTTVQLRLGLSERFRAWLDQLDAADQPCEPDLPGDAEADALLQRLGFPARERASCLAGRPDPVTHPEWWWVLGRAYQELMAKLGRNPSTYAYVGWPAHRDPSDPVGRQLYVWAFLAATPRVRRFHEERGIPDDVSWDTLAALGRDMTLWNAIYGENGLNGTWMLPLIYQGVSYRLGRHVFDRGAGALNVHIPEGEPLDPAASQASFDRARRFFPVTFPRSQSPRSSVTRGCWTTSGRGTCRKPRTSCSSSDAFAWRPKPPMPIRPRATPISSSSSSSDIPTTCRCRPRPSRTFRRRRRCSARSSRIWARADTGARAPARFLFRNR